MEMILDDFSLHGQFVDVDDFCSCLQKNIIPCLDLARRKAVPFYKSYNSYSCVVFNKTTLHDLLSQNGNARLAAFKIYLIKFIRNPFWNANPQTNLTHSISGFVPIPNCITEAFYRKGTLLSFEKKEVILLVNGVNYIVPTADCKRTLLKIFSDNKILSLQNRFFIPGYSRYEFEIRIKEPTNHVPHFHICVDREYDASVSLETFEILASNVKNDNQDRIFGKAIELIKKNKDDYLEVWYYYHPVNGLT